MRYCKKTNQPESAVNVSFDENSVSSAYNATNQFIEIKEKVWKERKNF